MPPTFKSGQAHAPLPPSGYATGYWHAYVYDSLWFLQIAYQPKVQPMKKKFALCTRKHYLAFY